MAPHHVEPLPTEQREQPKPAPLLPAFGGAGTPPAGQGQLTYSAPGEQGEVVRRTEGQPAGGQQAGGGDAARSRAPGAAGHKHGRSKKHKRRR
jgi:hypothetical protein